MKNWIAFTANPAPIQAIYGNECPSLEGVSLHEVVIHRDGPRVLLRFDLAAFPTSPPAKWIASNFNRVQLKLLATGLSELAIAGIQANCRIDLVITEDQQVIRVRGDNGCVRIELAAEALLIDGISAYRDSSLAP